MSKVAREIPGPQPFMPARMIQTMSLALKSIAGVFSNTNDKSDKGFMTSETWDCHLGCAIPVRAVGWALISNIQVYDDVSSSNFNLSDYNLVIESMGFTDFNFC